MFSTGLFAIGVATAVLTGAAILQARLERVPNAVTLGSLVLAWTGALATTIAGVGSGGIMSSIGGAMIGGIMLFPLYLIIGLGAGCVKTQMSFGAWIGCAMGLSSAAVTIAVSTLGGIVMLFGLYAAAVRLYPSVEYDLNTWQMNAQSPLAIGSVAGLVGCLWYGAV